LRIENCRTCERGGKFESLIFNSQFSILNFQFLGGPQPMTPREELQLQTQHIGRRVLVYDRVDSTNSVAATLAIDPDNAGVVVLAHEQTQGRGQFGRHWQCPPGAGVLLSILLFPPPELCRPAILTAWAAVSVCETIRQLTGVPARIKWPNDVLLRSKKVCGILIEQGLGTVTGIGLNVNQPPETFAAQGLTHGSSLCQFTSDPLDSTAIAKRLITLLDEEYERLRQGDLNTLEACWKWSVGLLGRQVAAECADRTVSGRLLDLTFDGVLLKSASGEMLSLQPEIVKHLELSGNNSGEAGS
jgi:BirA family biotin operon repressor/biotin-[acetyl-CoA-carboxylase] ligase